MWDGLILRHWFLTSALNGEECLPSCQSHFALGTEPSVPTKQEAGWAPQPVCMLWRREKSLTSTRNLTTIGVSYLLQLIAVSHGQGHTVQLLFTYNTFKNIGSATPVTLKSRNLSTYYLSRSMSQYQCNCQKYSTGTMNHILPCSSPGCHLHMVES